MTYKPTAQDYIAKAIIEETIRYSVEDQSFSWQYDQLENAELVGPDETEDFVLTYENSQEILEDFEYFTDNGSCHHGATYCFRDSGEECNLSPEHYSRHYEVDYVVRKIDDKWIGWHYYSGGGKHGEPEAFDWINDAKFVEVESEKEVVQVVRTFKREDVT